jgi:preprotein translocase subunit SecD
MDNFKIKGVLILLVLLVGLVFAIPSLLGKTELPKGWIGPKAKLKLGLDLQGGIHLVLKVESIKAVENRLTSIAEDLKAQMMKERIRYNKAEIDTTGKLRIELRTKEDKDAFSKVLTESYPYLVEVNETTAADGTTALMYQIKPEEAKKIREQAVQQALETIRSRIDQFGVSEPSIIPEQDERIVLQLPGITNPERAKALIGRTALLEFKLVDEDHSLEDALKGNVPEGSYLAKTKDGQPILLKQQASLTGAMLTDAKVSIKSSYNEPYVAISFNKDGARIFERVTSENIGKRLAILLDGRVFSSPVIRDAIAGGNAIIEGRFSMDEAKDLAIILRAGSLPAPVNIIEERTVGPSLGSDSIHMGIIASLVGGLLVIIFMGVYYKVSGMLANFALIWNIVLLTGVMAAFHATLTVPGIAGIVLTIGMAVDANVLVFERIREEIRLGRTTKMAIEAGYSNAMSAVVDSNLTTLIAGLVLFQFGTGPIKGFAVTLCVGILTSMFTALVVVKWIEDWMVNYKKVDHISI